MLSWNDIRRRATEFAHNWQSTTRERAESQSFWNGFFQIFGKTREQFAVYERLVELSNDRHGRIDLLWPGVLAVEHKSTGADLRAAEKQMLEYLSHLPKKEIPRYYLICDFRRFA